MLLVLIYLKIFPVIAYKSKLSFNLEKDSCLDFFFCLLAFIRIYETNDVFRIILGHVLSS